MLFNTIDFAIFFPIVFMLCWALARHKDLRNFMLLGASYVFYGWWDWRFLILIFFSSCVDFFIGKFIHSASGIKKRKRLLFVSLIANLGLLFYFKYSNFFIETFIDSFRLFGSNLDSITLSIILPVGISFYTFQTLSYTIDIYKGKIEPTNDILSFFTFVSFFPQLVAGPIERASHLLPQFYCSNKFDYDKVKSGIFLIGFGLFKKMIIADRLAVVVNQVYNNPAEHAGYQVLIATIFFAFQIYCDFSGYSDIAIGASRMLGFDLMQNFDNPYFSKSIKEFWRRWHISLSTWFRDYVYIPLGGSYNGKNRTYLNLFIVFIISGLWHGAAMTFVIWGAIHGGIIVLEEATYGFRKRAYGKLGLDRNTYSNRLFFGAVTFAVVCFAWIFFRANSLRHAFILIKNSIVLNYDEILNGGLYSLGLESGEFWVAIIAVAVLLIAESVSEYRNSFRLITSQGPVFRYAFYILLLFSILIFGVYGDMTPKEFIYFQF